jgi:hypothetical protein
VLTINVQKLTQTLTEKVYIIDETKLLSGSPYNEEEIKRLIKSGDVIEEHTVSEVVVCDSIEITSAYLTIQEMK